MSITIREEDYTSAGVSEYSNFTVVVPGFINAAIEAKNKQKNIVVFDENGVYECHSQSDFKNKIGKVTGKSSDAKGKAADTPIHYGNQIAYELLSLGYTVLYKSLGSSVSSAALAALNDFDKFWAPLADKSTYDFRFIINGLLENNTDANNAISKLASFKNQSDYANKVGEGHFIGRGDCVALVDIDANAYRKAPNKTLSAIIAGIKEKVNALTEADTYTALFANTVCYKLPRDTESLDFGEHYTNNRFPASFHYLACAAEAARNNFAEWYAVAGFTRGVTSHYIIDSTELNLGEAAISALQPRYGNNLSKAVNIIAKVKKHYYLWGNRTAKTLKDEGDVDSGLVAQHFLNIRQLCTTIKKQAYIACKRYTFDPNSDVLWINFTSSIVPTLERMKADQGINDYRIVKVKSDKKAVFTAKIRIIPIEAVEDFDITLSLEDSFGDSEVSIEE